MVPAYGNRVCLSAKHSLPFCARTFRVFLRCQKAHLLITAIIIVKRSPRKYDRRRDNAAPRDASTERSSRRKQLACATIATRTGAALPVPSRMKLRGERVHGWLEPRWMRGRRDYSVKRPITESILDPVTDRDPKRKDTCIPGSSESSESRRSRRLPRIPRTRRWKTKIAKRREKDSCALSCGLLERIDGSWDA